MKPYTVLLLYPDYCGDYGEKTFLAHVEADSVEAAQLEARRQAYKEDNEGCTDAEVEDNMHDFAVLLVVAGHHDDLKKVD